MGQQQGRALLVALAMMGCMALAEVQAQASDINEAGKGCGDTAYLKADMNQCTIDGALSQDTETKYTFRISPDKSEFSVLLTLRTLDGTAAMSVRGPKDELITDTVVYTAHLNAVGESYIRIPAGHLEPGEYTIAISVTAALRKTIPLYLRVETFPAGVKLDADERKALATITKACCKPEGEQADPQLCSDILPSALGKDPTKDMCQVQNNICDAKGHLVHLSLGGADFKCPNFPKEFAKFKQLNTLDVAFNDFGGDSLKNVAKVLEDTANLQRLVIRYANLSGPITCEIFKQHKLKTLMLSFNPFTGSLPACVLESPTLEELYMSRLNLTGEIPDSIPEGSNLRLWYALNTVEGTMQQYDGGAFTGSLPSTLSNAKGMRYMELSYHDLSGKLPTLPDAMMVFDVSENSIEGSIPNVPENLLMLDLANNKIEGPLPDITKAASLSVLDLSNNPIGGSLPESFGAAAEALTYFDVSGAGLEGWLEGTDWSGLKEVTFFSLATNKLQGSVPASLGQLANLGHLDLHDNALGGDLTPFADALPKPKSRRRSLLSTASSSGGPVRSVGCPHMQQQLLREQSGLAVATARKQGEGLHGPGAWEVMLDSKWAARGGSTEVHRRRQLMADPAATPSTTSTSSSGSDSGMEEQTTTIEDFGNMIMFLDLSGNSLTGAIPDSMAHAQVFVDPTKYDTVTRIKMAMATRTFDISNNKLHGEFPAWMITQIPTVELSCGCAVYNNFTGNSLYCPTKKSLEGLKLDGDIKSALAANNLTCLLPGKEDSPMLLSNYLAKPAGYIESIPAAPAKADISAPTAISYSSSTSREFSAPSSSSGSGAGSSRPGKLPAGAVAGIVIGLVCGLAVLVGLGWFGYKHLVQPKRAIAFHKSDIPDDIPHGSHAAPVLSGPAQV